MRRRGTRPSRFCHSRGGVFEEAVPRAQRHEPPLDRWSGQRICSKLAGLA
jgi:hypothetical protein